MDHSRTLLIYIQIVSLSFAGLETKFTRFSLVLLCGTSATVYSQRK